MTLNAQTFNPPKKTFMFSPKFSELVSPANRWFPSPHQYPARFLPIAIFRSIQGCRGFIAVCLLGAAMLSAELIAAVPSDIALMHLPTDGDWSAQHVSLTNTPEAAFMTRVGDIDNLGFGWPTGFDPFFRATSPNHGWPWALDPNDPAGTDRIMVISSYAPGTPKCGSDGYTGATSRPNNSVQPVSLIYSLPPIQVTNAVLQIFFDDAQASMVCGHYQVTINGRQASFLEEVVNSLSLNGPVGTLVTVAIPSTFLNEVTKGQLRILIDDPTTGAGEGFAIDFAKLLVNVNMDADDWAPVSLVDTKLEGAVRQTLGKSSGILFRQDLRRLTILPAGRQGITNLAGLELAQDLDVIQLWENQIRDLSPLAACKRLRSVNLDGNLVSDISPLKGLPLTEIFLENNPVSNPSLLTNSPNLITVDVGNIRTGGDWRWLATFKNLQGLWAWNISMTNASMLSELTKLRYLDLNRNQISDATPLQGLTGMVELYLEGNHLTNASALAGLTNLARLNIANNSGLGNGLWLERMRDLVFLSAWQTGLTNTTPLKELTRLEYLHLADNPIRDITPLNGLTNMTELYLKSCSLTNFTPLAGLTRLGRLEVSDNPGNGNHAWLTGLTNINWFWAWNIGLTNAAPLSQMGNLQYLHLGANMIVDPGPLSKVTNLIELHIQDNKLMDFQPLAGLQSLRTVNCQNNLLDIRASSPSMSIINSWTSRGISVSYQPQRLVTPEIIDQPQSQIVRAGDTVAFSVGAIGTMPLSYQWFSTNDVQIAGATNATLVLSNVQPHQSGIYRAVVSNSAGSAPGVWTELIVLGPPSFTESLRDGADALGLTLSNLIPGKMVIFETSTNLRQWTPLLTNLPVNGRTSFSAPSGAEPQRFYRAKQ